MTGYPVLRTGNNGKAMKLLNNEGMIKIEAEKSSIVAFRRSRRDGMICRD